eukprot:CAMPEP_0206384006 /NCGR_PEP_ID=MMETSP0294-20121207/14303_1 /ASSEMBLY_ACC=CAM_ASM_000327 /TAXON_ID=39354 /ORGANISM="Heterosigma akashiwo, Strain CCMP2393" /LENGTH=61 /DNA_ID=CAMNT_0053834205 /DNA_START=359 /DNA_END=540 /DNA_ORIENTATION=+
MTSQRHVEDILEWSSTFSILLPFMWQQRMGLVASTPVVAAVVIAPAAAAAVPAAAAAAAAA